MAFLEAIQRNEKCSVFKQSAAAFRVETISEIRKPTNIVIDTLVRWQRD